LKILTKEELLVSNPWREAIEESEKFSPNHGDCVSNPWREAIEVNKLNCNPFG